MGFKFKKKKIMLLFWEDLAWRKLESRPTSERQVEYAEGGNKVTKTLKGRFVCGSNWFFPPCLKPGVLIMRLIHRFWPLANRWSK